MIIRKYFYRTSVYKYIKPLSKTEKSSPWENPGHERERDKIERQREREKKKRMRNRKRDRQTLT